MTRRTFVVAGAVLLILAMLLALFGAGIGSVVFFCLPSVVVLAIGGWAEWRARVFNARDWALADGMHRALNVLWQQPVGALYARDLQDGVLDNARLVEVRRHFDSETCGVVDGSLAHMMQLFGSSFTTTYGVGLGRSVSASSFAAAIGGLSHLQASVSNTTRQNMMGDALFAVFEARWGGRLDTFRVISMSRPAVMSWIADLVGQAGHQLGGATTHAGATIQNWARPLSERFAPVDVSYMTDQLVALHRRPDDEQAAVRAYGRPIGRNAMLASAIVIGDAEPLQLMPAGFPTFLAAALAEGVLSGERALAARGRPAPAVTASSPPAELR